MSQKSRIQQFLAVSMEDAAQELNQDDTAAVPAADAADAAAVAADDAAVADAPIDSTDAVDAAPAADAAVTDAPAADVDAVADAPAVAATESDDTDAAAVVTDAPAADAAPVEAVPVDAARVADAADVAVVDDTARPADLPVVDAAPVADAPAADAAVLETPAVEAPASDVVVDDVTVSTEGFGGAVKNFLLEGAAAVAGGVVGGAAGTLVAGPVGAVAGVTVGAATGHALLSNAVAKKSLVLKKNIDSLAQRIADAKKGDLAEARKNGIRLTASDKDLSREEVITGALAGFFIPFYNSYQGHKAEEMQKELQNKLGELKGVLEQKGVATESIISVESILEFGAAMEAEGIEPDMTDDAERPVDEAGDAGDSNDTIEAACAEAAETQAEMDTQTDAVSELEDVQEGLEALVCTLESAISQGGLHPQASQFFNIAYESFSDRLGIETNVPSMESYGGQTSRLNASMEAMSDVKAKLQQIWEAIKAILAKVRDAIVKFFSQITTAAGRLKMRAENLKKAAEGVKGEPKNQKIEFGTLAAKIAIGGNIAVGGLSTIETLVEETCKFDTEGQQQLTKDLDALKAASGSGERVSGLQQLHLPKSFKKPSGDGMVTDVLPGNVFFQISWRQLDQAQVAKFAGNAGAEMAAKFYNGWSISKEVSKQEVSTEIKIDTLSSAQMIEIADRCIKIADAVSERNKEIAANGKATAQAMKSVKLTSNVDGDAAKGVQADLKAFQKRAVAQDQASTKVLAYAVSTAGAYLSVAAKSLAQYNGNTAEA